MSQVKCLLTDGAAQTWPKHVMCWVA